MKDMFDHELTIGCYLIFQCKQGKYMGDLRVGKVIAIGEHKPSVVAYGSGWYDKDKVHRQVVNDSARSVIIHPDIIPDNIRLALNSWKPTS
jgi:hypothetical protein